MGRDFTFHRFSSRFQRRCLSRKLMRGQNACRATASGLVTSNSASVESSGASKWIYPRCLYHIGFVAIMVLRKKHSPEHGGLRHPLCTPDTHSRHLSVVAVLDVGASEHTNACRPQNRGCYHRGVVSMCLSIIGAVARRWSLHTSWRLIVAGRVEVDNSNPRPLRPIAKGTLTRSGPDLTSL